MGHLYKDLNAWSTSQLRSIECEGCQPPSKLKTWNALPYQGINTVCANTTSEATFICIPNMHPGICMLVMKIDIRTLIDIKLFALPIATINCMKAEKSSSTSLFFRPLNMAAPPILPIPEWELPRFINTAVIQMSRECRAIIQRYVPRILFSRRDREDMLPLETAEELLRQLFEHSGLLLYYFNGLYDEQRWGRSIPWGLALRALEDVYGKKRLVVCCDGTWKNASGTIDPLTNVGRFARSVWRHGVDQPTVVAAVPQVIYYSPGVGSRSVLSVDSSFSGTTGKGITSGILDAYCFLCNNYNFGAKRDEIILVGYSRGAFTVRCLAAFIDDIGLLRRKNLGFLQLIFKRWLLNEDERSSLRRELNRLRDFSFRVKIRVLAEWDTVSALGVPLLYQSHELSFVHKTVPGIVENAFFALAIDEKRLSFQPKPWEEVINLQTNVQQCAFTGSHGDIGGGYSSAGLSTISLLWMIGQICQVSRINLDYGSLFEIFTVFQSSPFQRNQDLGVRSWPWSKSKKYVRNLSLSTGNKHESRTILWKIPSIVSFGALSGRRTKIIESYLHRPMIKLHVHFTVALYAAHYPLGRKFTYRNENDDHRRWESTDGGYLAEAKVFQEERDLFQRWHDHAMAFTREHEFNEREREMIMYWAGATDALVYGQRLDLERNSDDQLRNVTAQWKAPGRPVIHDIEERLRGIPIIAEDRESDAFTDWSVERHEQENLYREQFNIGTHHDDVNTRVRMRTRQDEWDPEQGQQFDEDNLFGGQRDDSENALRRPYGITRRPRGLTTSEELYHGGHLPTGERAGSIEPSDNKNIQENERAGQNNGSAGQSNGSSGQSRGSTRESNDSSGRGNEGPERSNGRSEQLAGRVLPMFELY
ncbi:hypothetical protein F4777DRAFT_527859 [Nemania sp. FL0916]|nr:hypothetical protein F4777DRAFT_527859 [Nemania sp. FL0916]